MADNDSLLHTQLWIDPKEEFLQYVHNGDPVDVTFSVKELKVQLAKPFDCSRMFKFYRL
jgi:cell cycle checkpoint control protein RAD9A